MTTEDRIAALEVRLQAAEDHLEILNLISAYGPLADSCSVDEVAGQWIDGGGYNYGKPDGGSVRLVDFGARSRDQYRNIITQEEMP